MTEYRIRFDQAVRHMNVTNCRCVYLRQWKVWFVRTGGSA